METRICQNDNSHVQTRILPARNHTHVLNKTEAVPAACETDGNIEYWTCVDCRNLFSDEAGTRQINPEDTVVKATGHKWGEWTAAKDQEGVEIRICRNDPSHTETRTIEKPQPQPGPGSGGGGVSAYTVTVKDADNGTVTASRKTAEANAAVTLTVKPGEGYQLDKLAVTDRNNNAVTLTKNEDGTYTFKMPASNVTVTPAFAAVPVPVPADTDGGACPKDASCPISAFSDASPTEWYHDGVHWALAKELMNGIGNGSFAPNGTTTRAMVVTMLWRLEGKPDGGSSPFTDVPADTWYTQAVSWAAEAGVVKGVSETEFAPDTPVTREQLAAILYRYAQAKGWDVSVGEDTNILSYDDAFSVSGWAMEAMQWACGAGILNGRTASTLVPGGNATRAEIATMFMRFCESAEQ